MEKQSTCINVVKEFENEIKKRGEQRTQKRNQTCATERKNEKNCCPLIQRNMMKKKNKPHQNIKSYQKN